ncbi:FMN-binding split barrel [Phaffia rhodozyma]|uniref:FMN-binding split barrel n=1 Tax=Phaffia rhodozyma TaxID=264483 RepID=A0A0F7SWM2_PHARH|nr:FMN-binding split barrel [Phaffia rhodozyma]
MFLSSSLVIGTPVQKVIYPDQSFSYSIDRQTMPEAAVSARKLLTEQGTGTIGTVFPADRPDDIAGSPFALMEYQVPHPKDQSSLLLLLMPISTSTKNILASSSHEASFTVQNSKGRVDQERVSLIGNVTLERELTMAQDALYTKHYLRLHPEAIAWLPSAPASPHVSYWARLDPREVYYVGGFGDTKYIGWIDLDTWKNV